MNGAPLSPLMAITLGDVAGVGPEIVLKAAADPEAFELCRPLAVGLVVRSDSVIGTQEVE